MNHSIREFGGVLEEKLQKAYKSGNYDKKFGYEGIKSSNMDQAFQNSTDNMSAFDKILAKDSRKLNRMQA